MKKKREEENLMWFIYYIISTFYFNFFILQGNIAADLIFINRTDNLIIKRYIFNDINSSEHFQFYIFAVDFS